MKNLKVGILAAASALATVVSCDGGQELPSEASSEAPPEEARREDPVVATSPDETDDESIGEFIAGYDTGEVFWAVEAARADVAGQCMDDRGADGSVALRIYQGQRQSADVDADRPVTSAIQYLSTAQPEEPIINDQVTHAIWVECFNSAAEELPNPNMVWLDLLDQLNQDVVAEVEGDSAVIEAERARQECVASTGFGGATGPDGLPVEPESVLQQEVQNILQQYKSGAVSRETAAAELEVLKPREGAFLACSTPFNAVLSGALKHFWSIQIDENQGLVQKVRESLLSQVDQYEEYLD
jgi:hypothetical protein